MCSKFNRTPCGLSCACAVACLCPHNSISNVVASLTIHDDMNIFVQEMFTKKMKPLWKVEGFFNRKSWKESDVQIVRETWVLSLCHSVSLSLCLSLCPSVSVCCVLCVVCCVVVLEEGGREESETNRNIWLLIPAKISLKISEN